MNLRQAILDIVFRLGSGTVDKIFAEVARVIPAATAAVAGRRDRRMKPVTTPKISLVERGRRRLVTEALTQLCKTGKLRRVRRGVYATPGPKLYVAG